MKKLIAFTSAAVAASALFAAPQVSNVTMTQDASKTVTITYELKGEPGIVTVDIQTNTLSDATGEWVSIGGAHLTYFAGDANKIVQPTSAGETRKITWKPRKAWPDNEVTEKVKAVLSAWSLNAPPDYMVTSLSVPSNTWFYTCAENIPFGVTDDLYKTEYLVMRKIPAANVRWRMGSPTTETGREPDGTGANKVKETPHVVTLSNDYYIGVYEFTQRQYELAGGSNPSYFTNKFDYATRPVEKVSTSLLRGNSTGSTWPTDKHNVSANSFFYALRNRTGIEFDLPTEAQWEFACRAGCGSALYSGKELDNTTTSANVNELGRYNKNYGTKSDVNCRASEGGTAKVGSYKENAWGLYDMLGNVAEYCLDYYRHNPTGYDWETGPLTPMEGLSTPQRTLRGGAWNSAPGRCRSAYRWDGGYNGAYQSIGFRVWCAADFSSK